MCTTKQKWCTKINSVSSITLQKNLPQHETLADSRQQQDPILGELNQSYSVVAANVVLECSFFVVVYLYQSFCNISMGG